MKPSFTGFSPDSFQFFADLSQHNNKTWFTEQKERYQEVILNPASALVTSLGARLKALDQSIDYDEATNGWGSIFRIYRDVRFSKDKSPYKTHLGVLFWRGDLANKKENPGFYFHLDQEKAFLAAGAWVMHPQALDSFRQRVIQQGEQVKKLMQGLEKAGFTLEGKHYKRLPKGLDKDSPHQDLLLFNSLYAMKDHLDPKLVCSPDLVEQAAKAYQQCLPLVEWVSDCF